MKKLLLGAATLAIIFLATVLILPTFINWNQYREEIASQARNALGRELNIKGDIKLTILPSPALAINGIHLANVEGTSTADMLTLKSLEVNVALIPLLGQNIQITSVRLVEPVVNMEILEDGTNNLAFGAAITEQPEGSVSSSVSATDTQTERALANVNGLGIPSVGGFAVQIDSFVIENGQLTLRDVPRGRVERIETVNGKFRLASLNGPMEIEGGAFIRKIPMSFSASVGQIVQDRTLPFRLAAKVIPGNVNLSYSGAMSNLRETPMLKGKFSLEGKNLNTFVSGVANGMVLPSALGRAFSVQATIAASQTQIDIPDLAFSLDETKGTGKVSAVLGPTPGADVMLTINKVDLDKLLVAPPQPTPAPPKEPTTSSSPSTSSPPVSIQPSAFQSADTPLSLATLPENLVFNLDLSIEALKFKGKAIRHANLTAELAGREVTLSQLSALLPGNTDLAMFGFISQKGPAPAFDGTVDLATNDLRGMLDWLGTDASGIAQDRLRKLSFSGKVLAGPQSLNFSGFDLKVDNTKIKGAAVIAPGERVSLGLNLDVNKINLDAYLPAPKNSAVPKKELTPKLLGTSQDQTPAGSKSPPSPSPGYNPLAPLGLLGALDINLKAKVGSLTVKGVPVSNLAVDSALLNGRLTLNNLSFQNLAGIRGKVTGSLVGLTPVDGVADPTFKDFTFDIRGKSLRRFFKFAEIQSPIDPGRFGAVALTGSLNGHPRTLDVTAAMRALRGRFGIDATVKTLGPVPSLTGQLSLSHPSVIRFLRAFDIKYRPVGRNLGGIKLKSNITASSAAITLSRMTGTAAGVSLSGDLRLKLNGPKPALMANLTTGALDLNKYLSKAKSASVEDDILWRHAFEAETPRAHLHKASWSRLSRAPVPQPLLHKVISSRWSKDPMDISALNSFDADVTLKTPRLKFGKLPLDNVDLAVTLNNGVLDVRRATGNLFRGKVKLGGKAAATSGTGHYQSRFTLQGVSMPLALRAFGTRTLKSGTMEVTGEFRSSGRSVADMISRLTGTGSISLNALDVSKGAGAGSALSGVTNLLAALSQFAGSLGGRVVAVKADLRGSFKVEKGIASYDDMTLTSSLGNGSAKGVVDLLNWRINTSGTIDLSQNLLLQVLADQKGASLIPFQLSGPMEKPSVKLDTSKIGAGLRIPGGIRKKIDKVLRNKGFGDVLQNIFPGTRSSKPPAQQRIPGASKLQRPQRQKQQPSPTPKPEDFLKNILRGLGR